MCWIFFSAAGPTKALCINVHRRGNKECDDSFCCPYSPLGSSSVHADTIAEPLCDYMALWGMR